MPYRKMVQRRERSASREQMIQAVGEQTGNSEWTVKSSQQAPGKRGERPPSYREGQRTLNKKLAQAQPSTTPRAQWFVAGALASIFLLWYNGVLMHGV